MFLGKDWQKGNLSQTFRTYLSTKLNETWGGDAVAPLKKEFIEKTRFFFDGRLTLENRQEKTKALMDNLNQGFRLGEDHLFKRTKTYKEAEVLAKTYGEEKFELEEKTSVWEIIRKGPLKP
jgi:ABC-type ATPase with predicted acetyltransferase domain